MKHKKYPHFPEILTEFKIHDRLSVKIIEKPQFHKTFVTLSIPLGSIHRSYKAHGKIKEVPLGTAHFLEHKIFEIDGNDVSKFFTLKEASVNAFTEHNHTTYLFSATNHLLENITRLIDMCFNPVFTEKGVQKEKSIIIEELDMHTANPYYIQYQTILKQLFFIHPIKDDILGDKESINSISKSILTAIHKAYYQPETCLLVIVGNVNAKEIYPSLQKISVLPPITKYKPHNENISEPHYVVTPYEMIELDVLMPSVLIGIKIMPKTQDLYERLREAFALSIFMDLAFGRSSDYHEQLLEANIINDSYGIDVQIEQEYGYILIGSESLDEKQLKDTFVNTLNNLNDIIIQESDYLRIKNQLVGNFVMSLDSTEYIAHEVSKYAQYNVDVFELLELAQSITYEEVVQCKNYIQPNNVTTLIITPKKNQ